MLGSMAHRDRLLLRAIARHAAPPASGVDVDLAGLAAAMRQRLAVGQGLDAVLPEAFGAMCEAYRCMTGHGPGQVLILAGLALHRGAVAQLAPGEDVAVAAAFPALLRALDGGGVHVVTGPSSEAGALAERVGPLLETFGLSVGVLELSPTTGAPPLERRRSAYAADVTFGDYRDFGYDYLRDNISHPGETVQTRMRCAFVMEADAVLLGQAFAPLMIEGVTNGNDPTAAAVAPRRLAEITVRAMYRRYEHLSGICTDPDADAARFGRLYGLPVVGIVRGAPSESRRGMHRLPMLRGRRSAKAVAARRAKAVRESDDRALQKLDQVVTEQREEIYAMRQAMVTGARPPQHTMATLMQLVDGLVARHCPPTAPRSAWEPSKLRAALLELYPTQLNPGEVVAQALDHAAVAALCRTDAARAYRARVTQLHHDNFAYLEKLIAMSVIDRCWREHLAALTDLRRTIRAPDWPSGFRLYRAEATDAFRVMLDKIDREIIFYVFSIETNRPDAQVPPG
jgi:preprotein translocase subunit SecA